MPFRERVLAVALPACAPLPALVIGILAMRNLGVSTATWSINLAATAFGLLLWFAGRRLPPLHRSATTALVAAASLAILRLPFAYEGTLGVHRWITLASVRLHASAIVAPLLIWSVAAAAAHRFDGALAIAVCGTIILALQPDAAQATSLAAACAVILVCARPRRPLWTLLGVAFLFFMAVVSLVRPDPLPPVAHVEGIFAIVAAKGPGPALIATLALLLLTVPFFAAWRRHRDPVSLALGVYIAMTLLAPAWGTFPVPVMGYGASPIVGYFLALAVAARAPLAKPSDDMQY